MPTLAAAASGGTYRSLFELSPQPTLLVDRASLRVLRANDAAATQYGYAREALADLPLDRLWPQAGEDLAPGKQAPRTARHRRAGGEAIDVEIHVREVGFTGQPALALFLSDVTERTLSTALLEAHNRVLDLIVRGSRLETVLEELVLSIERLSSGMIGSVLLLDDEGRRLRHGAAPSLPPAYWRAIDGLEIGPRVGSCGTAMFLAQPVIAADIATDPLWEGYRELALPYGLRACWSVPVRSVAGAILGAFAMYYREPAAPRGRDLRLVDEGAALATIAIERCCADRAVQESEARLRAILDRGFAQVWLKDLQGRYLLVNRRFEAATGVPASVAIGRTDRQLFERPLAQAHGARDGEALRGEPVEFEAERAQPDGRHLYHTVKFPLLRADGRPYALCCVASDITERKRTERSLEQSREELRALAARLHSVREEERMRISRDIHDHLGQALTVLGINQTLLVRSLREALTPEREALAAQLESMRGLVDGLLASVRRIVTELRPEILDTLGVAAAIEWQAAEFARRTGIECTVSLPGGAVALASEAGTALFRIFQEALSNVARHSGAKSVRVELRHTGEAIEMTVTDDGRGFIPAPGGGAPSLGLLGMRERAAMLGGTATITSAPGCGTTVAVRLPAG